MWVAGSGATEPQGLAHERRPQILYFLGVLAEIAIRVPHERRRRRTRMTVNRVSGSGRRCSACCSWGCSSFPPSTLTPWLDRADYRMSPGAKGWIGGIGATILASAVWLFWRSHADLGRNWLPSLQLREEHQLVTTGVYRSIRSDVRVPVAVERGATLVAPELDRRLVRSFAIPALVPVTGAARGADDARTVRGSVPRVHETNGARHSSPRGSGHLISWITGHASSRMQGMDRRLFRQVKVRTRLFGRDGHVGHPRGRRHDCPNGLLPGWWTECSSAARTSKT